MELDTRSDEVFDQSPTTDEQYEVLSNRRRRYTIHALKQQDEVIEVGSLADQVTAWEEEVPIDRISREGRHSVYNSLRQIHLPKLDDTEIVEFDKDRGTIAPTAEIKDLEIYMEFVEGKQLPWHMFQLQVAAVSFLLLVAIWLEVWPFVLLPDIAWTGVIVAMICVVAVVQYYDKKRMQLGKGPKPPEIR